MEHGFKGLMDLCKRRPVQWTPLPAWFGERLIKLDFFYHKVLLEPLETSSDIKLFASIKRRLVKGPHDGGLTCSHEFIDFGWTSLGLLHTVTFLQEVIHLR